LGSGRRKNDHHEAAHRHFPELHGTFTIYAYPAFASMGLGAVNEIIEFVAVLVFPQTNVGGYANTALDLVFNSFGAIFSVATIFLVTSYASANASPHGR
jgi:hypothetical protein